MTGTHQKKWMTQSGINSIEHCSTAQVQVLLDSNTVCTRNTGHSGINSIEDKALSSQPSVSKSLATEPAHFSKLTAASPGESMTLILCIPITPPRGNSLLER